MLGASLAEIASIGAVIPFLGVLTGPERLFNHPLVQALIKYPGYTRPDQLLLPLTVAFSLVALGSGLMRLALLWFQTRLGHAIGADISINIYRRTLYQPYTTHLSRNSSEVIAGISGKTNAVVYAVVLPSLLFASSMLIILAIMAALLAIEPVVALSAFGGFAAIYLVVILLTRKRVAIDSQRISHEEVQVIKALQEGLGGIRDVLLDGTQDAYCRIYRAADQPLRRAQANIQIIGASPRYGIEALGMMLIAMLAYSLTRRTDDIMTAVPILGGLALGAQRLLPALQQAYSAWASIRGGSAPLHDALDLLDQPLPAYLDTQEVPLPFERAIQLKGISFGYSEHGPLILKDLDLTIPKGSRVGLIGTTGSGKSTLLDIFMGLLQPSSGEMLVDDRSITVDNYRAWQKHITHVPQAIFLADTTIAENIAFGIPRNEIDLDRVCDAARRAQIAGTIEGWTHAYDTYIGERGVRLSGGQRQRIGIARALYKQADVIVFDEATSALDNETEKAVMEAIDNLSGEITVLIVAHRLSTLRNCSMVVELVDGKVSQIGSYQEIVRHQEQ